MRYLDRIILRELAANKSRTFVLVLALGVAFLMPAGIEMGLRSLLQTRSSFTAAHRLADLEIRMLPKTSATCRTGPTRRASSGSSSGCCFPE